MSEIKDIIIQLNNLPRGYISEKTIHDKKYYYRQMLEAGKIKSYYVSEAEIDNVKKQLAYRKMLEKELETYLNSGRNIPRPSKRSRELSGNLMMGDTVVAKFDKGVMVSLNEELCPLMIKRTHNLSEYLASRAIDRGRTNSRVLKKALGINESSDDMVALYSFGATITDNYWFKAKGSKLKYSDIAFEYDFYSDIALKGELLIFPKSPKYTPQINVPGSYEKCWKRINDEWWLFKQGSENEIFSELFCSALAKRMGIASVEYEYDGEYIRTKNFADVYNFEPMTSIAADDDSYDNVFNLLNELNADFAKDYLMLIFFDTIVNNIDRHNENCGLLRDKSTGKIVSLAPNFDNNLALIARSEVLNMNPQKDGFISYFKNFIKNNETAASYYRDMKQPVLNESIIRECLDDIPIKKNNIDITSYVLNRYEYLVQSFESAVLLTRGVLSI